MDWTDRLLILLAAAYLALIAVGVSGDGLHSSADRVSHGDLWLLLTSALNMVPELDVAQWFLLAAATSLVIFRHGPRLWWTVALTGHIGAALISYAIIGAAIWLGSGSADEAASQADYGISIVLAATVGAIAASGFSVPSRQRDRAGIGGPALFVAVVPLLVGCAVGGIGHGIKNTLTRTIIHEMVPGDLHGRAFAAFNAMRNSAEVTALAIGGIVVTTAGPRLGLLIAGFGPVLIALVALFLLRSGSLFRAGRFDPEPGGRFGRDASA